ncbi:type I 3-dehydroquinate dehydratase [Eubacterium sp.]|uniref:type I 3-dehydroquinate dehydratase n=1 Tax=Eubacterium sp. TaxID=142586 RepID=UPI002FC77964
MMKVIKKDTFALCVPITPRNAGELMEQVQVAIAAEPDFIEWRRDYFEPITLNEEQELLSKIKGMRGGVGLIYTYRSPLEGGVTQVEEAHRLAYILACIACDGADYIDVELDSSAAFKAGVKKALVEKEGGLILSRHHFDECVSEEAIEAIFSDMVQDGADILKLAMMPKTQKDVRQAIAAIIRGGAFHDAPIISILMGAMGGITRIFPDYTGGSLSFATVVDSTAPGQLSVSEVRSMRKSMGINM